MRRESGFVRPRKVCGAVRPGGFDFLRRGAPNSPFGLKQWGVATRQGWSRRKEDAVLSEIEFIVQRVRIPSGQD